MEERTIKHTEGAEQINFTGLRQRETRRQNDDVQTRDRVTQRRHHTGRSIAQTSRYNETTKVKE